MTRIPTGIPGFDPLIEGGFPEKAAVVISGGPGTGKTTFALQFLVNGIEQYDERGVYVGLEEDLERLRDGAQRFGWDFRKMEEDGKLLLMEKANFTQDLHSTKAIGAESILEKIQNFGAKRVAFDSINLMQILSGDKNEIEYRSTLIDLIEKLREAGVTIVFVHERGEIKYSLVDFICDGIIWLQQFQKKDRFLTILRVVKMRYTKADRKLVPYSITDKGIEVYPDSKVVQ